MTVAKSCYNSDFYSKQNLCLACPYHINSCFRKQCRKKKTKESFNPHLETNSHNSVFMVKDSESSSCLLCVPGDGNREAQCDQYCSWTCIPNQLLKTVLLRHQGVLITQLSLDFSACSVSLNTFHPSYRPSFPPTQQSFCCGLSGAFP